MSGTPAALTSITARAQVDRPIPLAGPVAAEPKVLREVANDTALGGVRSPHLSVAKPRRALQASSGSSAALNVAQVLFQGGSTEGFSASAVSELRTSLRRALGVSGKPPRVGFYPAVFDAVR